MLDFEVNKTLLEMKSERLNNFKNQFIGQVTEIFNKEKQTEKQRKNKKVKIN